MFVLCYRQNIVLTNFLYPQREKILLIKAKLCNRLLRMLLLHIIIYLKSILRYKFLILDTYLLDALYLCEQGCEDPRLFFETKKGLRKKPLWKHWRRS